MKPIHVEDSDKVRFGLSAFVPKHNLATREEAIKTIHKQNERGYAEKFVLQCSSESESEDESEHVIYRYVKQTKKAAPEPSPLERAEVSVENLAALNLMNDLHSPKLETRKTTLKVNVDAEAEADDIPVRQYSRHTTQSLRVPEKANAPPTVSSSKSTTSVPTAPNNSKADKKSNAKASVSIDASVASNHSKVKATAQVATPAAYNYTESEIRIFARDEVERYRQAERMMHAHPNAYAHGRLVPVVPEVPVERRIEVVTDNVKAKPWEAPAARTSATEKVPISRCTKYTSTASRDGTASVSDTPSEDSRHWYRVVDNAASATRSAREKSNTSQTGKSDKDPQRAECNVEVTVERSGRPDHRSTQGRPESDLPASVKLKEVLGMIREEPSGPNPAYASTGRSQRPDVIEVIEEIELPPAPPVSHRVKVLRKEPAGEEKRTRRVESAVHSRETSFRTDKSYWEDEGVVRTASRQSSTRQQADDDANMSSKTPSLRAEQGSTSSELGDLPEKMVAMPSPRQFLPRVSSHGRSEDDSWYASRVRSIKKNQQTPDQLKANSKPQDDDEKTVWPKDDAPIRPAASERASLREDWDWEYRKRIMQAVNRPSERDFDHSRPGKYYTDKERMVRRRRPSEPIAREIEPPHQPSCARSSHPSERRASAAPSSPTISVFSEYKKKPSPPQDRGRGPYMRTSDESAHVRFASKVEFSPTPPGSDEYLPERLISQSKPSSTPSSKAQGRKSALRNQIDGGASEPPESAEDLIAEYESNRSRSGRSVEAREELEYVSARGASSAASRSMASEAPISQPQSNYSYTSRRSASMRGGGSGSSWTAPRETNQDDERQSFRSLTRSETNRRSSPTGTGTGTETATQLSRSRKLARALSESPSRERLRQDSLRVQREESDKVEAEVDGKGPYREEIRTESMDALYGSGHGGARGRAREDLRERW